MSSAIRPSDVYGHPAHPSPQPPGSAPEPPPEHRSRRRWPVAAAGALAVVVVVAGLLLAPGEVGEGGVPPARLDVISEDQAIAALALHGAHAEVQESLTLDRSLFAPPGTGVVVQAAERGTALVADRLRAARALADADPAVARYWGAPAQDAHLEEIRQAERDIGEINVLALIHATLYEGGAAIPLDAAQFELANRYSTGVADRDRPLLAWGRALLEELDGLDARADADRARGEVDGWWRQRTGALDPPAGDRLRAYLGGLPDATVRDLEEHPVAGPGLAALRSGS